MSRDGRSDVRAAPLRRPASRTSPRRRIHAGLACRWPGSRPAARPTRVKPVRVRDTVYRLRESEASTLATVGTFRVVRADDLQPTRSSRDAWSGDLRSLAEQGLVAAADRRSESRVHGRRGPHPRGEAPPRHAPPPEADDRGPGVSRRPREAARDRPRRAALSAAIRPRPRASKPTAGASTRVVLDYELKRDYQTFLNRHGPTRRRQPRGRHAAFAARREAADRRRPSGAAGPPHRVRDRRRPRSSTATSSSSPSTTRGANWPARARAGFALYRAAGAGGGRGGAAGAAARPFDPHHLERL